MHDFLGGDVPEHIATVAALLVTELATNAVVHGRTAYTITASLTPWRLRVEVTDGSAEVPALLPRESGAIGGWGMHIVEELASQWNVDRHAGGKTVWFELSIPPDAPRPP